MLHVRVIAAQILHTPIACGARARMQRWHVAYTYIQTYIFLYAENPSAKSYESLLLMRWTAGSEAAGTLGWL